MQKLIPNSEIIYPYYPDDNNCVYCRGDYPVDKTRFSVLLKNGESIAPICPVCLYEKILEHCAEIKIITNIGER